MVWIISTPESVLASGNTGLSWFCMRDIQGSDAKPCFKLKLPHGRT